MKKILHKIFQHNELIKNPPVFIDIGASGSEQRIWDKISKYAICIAFDADNREFSIAEKDSKKWKKLLIVNKIVSENDIPYQDFYLTKFPYCSSKLKPNLSELSNWAFAEYFEVDKKIQLESVTLTNILSQLNIGYIDWYKTDTQGCDLRIFNSLAEEVKQNILAAEFEPGIIDAYEGEDKIWEIMAYMHNRNYWVSSFDIKGSQRIGIPNQYFGNKLFKKYSFLYLVTTPGWGELMYLKNIQKTDSLRTHLMACSIAIIAQQFGFAIQITQQAQKLFSDSLFVDIELYAIKKIKNQIYRFPLFILERLINRFFKFIYRFVC